ncbi:DUF4382 domain-containing protein [uncultured Psychroserpens sp.]|uniref:DUF4382 domain-containing protein n=1 Tax=uncultured Psychroserpens sp. TaxID=255436 RepID=UPI0026251A33|nr:DUF4382 domain-containing protein [uncultured Psychroserpens sp.]
MKYFQFAKAVLFSLMFLFFLSSCSKEEATTQFENSLVSVKLVGTETPLNKVNIEILDVQFRIMEDESDPNAWVSLNAMNTGVHDLTNFTTDQVVTLVDFEQVPSEFIYSIKLVLGDNNSVVKTGIEYDLIMAPEYEGASVNIVEKQLVANKLYDFTIEVDLDESIVFSSDTKADFQPKMNTLMRLFNLF